MLRLPLKPILTVHVLRLMVPPIDEHPIRVEPCMRLVIMCINAPRHHISVAPQFIIYSFPRSQNVVVSYSVR